MLNYIDIDYKLEAIADGISERTVIRTLAYFLFPFQAHSVSETGTVLPNVKTWNDAPLPSTSTSETISRRRGRRKWIKTLRDLEMQWDDPVTGDKKILWEEIDYNSRFIFPILFFLFSLIYFCVLMLS